MTPKSQQLFDIAQERMESLFNDLKQEVIPEDYEDIIKMIRRAEYKRGKEESCGVKK